MRASIDLHGVSVEFPIYSAKGRSFRSDMLRRIGGRIQTSEDSGRMIVRALNDIDLHLRPGDRLGLIGSNGAGKSTLLRVLAGVYEPPKGSIKVVGKVSSLLDINLGTDPELNGYDNIVMRSVLLGMSFKEAHENIAQVAEFSELGDFLSLPVRTYSSGMAVRLAFGISTSVQPDILLLDEMIGVGDASFAHKAVKRMQTLVEGASILVLASHSAITLQSFCNKLAVMEAGSIVSIGPIDEVMEKYNASTAA